MNSTQSQSTVSVHSPHTGRPGATASHTDFPNVLKSLLSVCDKVAPVWPLADYVAVNPYMGFVQQEFFATSRQLRQFSTCLTAMPLTYYQERFRSGAIQREDIELAIDELVESGVSEAELLTGHCLVGLLEQGRSDDR
ncbi:MAG TPA: Na-translocating system protein MpsB, partial [Lacipirellulaceae bacterium]|nr:Na-translocating system protein MpsB [Lacipirellulaceae bacterium]